MFLTPQIKKCECIHLHYSFFYLNSSTKYHYSRRSSNRVFFVLSPSYPSSTFRSSTLHTDYLYVHKIFLWPFLWSWINHGQPWELSQPIQPPCFRITPKESAIPLCTCPSTSPIFGVCCAYLCSNLHSYENILSRLSLTMCLCLFHLNPFWIR